jgi:hypothetical protein
MKKFLKVIQWLYIKFRDTKGSAELFTPKKKIGACTVTVTFSDAKNPDLKQDLLWNLTQCYEERIKNTPEQLEFSEFL